MKEVLETLGPLNYLICMKKSLCSALVMALIFFSLPVFAENSILAKPVFPEGAEVAFDVVSCTNTVNGHIEPVAGTPWELTQAVLELPYQHESERLDDGFFFVVGRRLGYHVTWIALLDISQSDRVAYEVRDEQAGLWTFGASLVPPEVISALGECNVRWGGFWGDEFPTVVVDAPAITPLPPEQRLPDNPLRSGADLLPPIVADK
ncbi:hypothetical protein K3740_00565 [Ruegeria conchae]|uniref:hypothetical protein n=1 Tax=Ruegeria conchae TaxID=981384 RepID=UPI0021A634FD|nr:hypothetical protein [Ruegeria conchae]UWR03240.1 hypothetical protein K3740_00565 [Ruegeria conchae]